MFESVPRVRFAEPVWLALLLSLPLLVYWGRRSISGLGRARSTAATIVRMLLVGLLAGALARAQLVMLREDMAVAFVVDTSLSVPAERQRESLDYVTAALMAGGESGSRRPGDKVALVTFGKTAAIDQAFTVEALDASALHAVVNGEHTNIAAAIRSAMAAMPQAGRRRLVLVSDGNENDGAALSEAAAAKSAGVRIDCLPVRYNYSREVMIEKITAPQEVAAGKTVPINVLVRAFNEATGTLRLFANDSLIAEEEVSLEPGINAFVVEKPLPSAGVYDFRAVIESSEDSLYQNNQATAFSLVRGEKRVLLVAGAPEDGDTLAQALEGEKVGVDVTNPGGIPGAMALLTGYDTVILANVPAYDLSAEAVKILAAAVKDYGVGLVMIGGKDSFGAGGWKGTPVEEVMPVEMDVKDRQVIPAGALVVIMHTCEFADGNRWGIDIAKAAVDTLGQYDEFGLIYYGQRAEAWLVPLSPVTDRVKIKSVINTMDAGDMPYFEPTIRMAENALVKSQASAKHVVIISDGDPTAPSTQYLQSVAGKGITVSTVAVFPHDPTSTGTLQAIAKICNGRFYYPRSPTQLPQIFIKEARTVRRGLINENEFKPRMVMATVPLTGFTQEDFPRLKGYVISTPKPLAETPLLTAHDDPLLAHWQAGLGRTVAFTSDAKPQWAAEWVGWPGYRRFWGQTVEWVERKVETGEFATTCRVSGDTAEVSIEAVDKKGEFVNFLQFTGKVVGPDGATQDVSLEQIGPGRYEGTFKADQVGTYVPVVWYKDDKGNPRKYETAVTVPFSPEYRALSTNEVLLREISSLTGGEVIEPTADAFRRDFPPEASYSDVWQWITCAAVGLFLVDVFLRRVMLDYALMWRRGVELGGMLLAGRRAGARQKAEYTSALLEAKKAARATRQEAAGKFAAEEGAGAVTLEKLQKEQSIMRARAAREKSRSAEAPAREVAPPEVPPEDSYTGRLLDAKRRARKETGEQRPDK